MYLISTVSLIQSSWPRPYPLAITLVQDRRASLLNHYSSLLVGGWLKPSLQQRSTENSSKMPIRSRHTWNKHEADPGTRGVTGILTSVRIFLSPDSQQYFFCENTHRSSRPSSQAALPKKHFPTLNRTDNVMLSELLNSDFTPNYSSNL